MRGGHLSAGYRNSRGFSGTVLPAALAAAILVAIGQPSPGQDASVQYTVRGDGGGFGGTNSAGRVSPDGRDFTLIFTGTGEWDSWNTVRGRFTLSEATDTSQKNSR
jgi:hypothetical protein